MRAEGETETHDEAEDSLPPDSYLDVPEQPQREWQPLSLVLGVPGLPKGALVELQPLACLLEVCMSPFGCMWRMGPDAMSDALVVLGKTYCK